MFCQVRIKISFPPLAGPLGQSPLELDVGFHVPQEDPTFPLEGYARSSPHQNFPHIWTFVCGFMLP